MMWPAPLELDENGLPVLNGYIDEAGHALAADSATVAADSEKVDGIHAATSAVANYLCALDAAAKLPASITGDADTTDGLHAATSGASAHLVSTSASGATQIDGALTLLSTLIFGTTSQIRLKFIPRKQTVDGTATAVFTITTSDETGDADAGSYTCFVLANIDHAAATTTSYAAAKGFFASFTRVTEKTGTGLNTAVTEIYESASVATDAPTRDIGTVTMTVTETSEYVQTVEFSVDVTGTSATNPFVTCWVLLLWGGFTTAPVIAAA